MLVEGRYQALEQTRGADAGVVVHGDQDARLRRGGTAIDGPPLATIPHHEQHLEVLHCLLVEIGK